jgi:general stress protein CsbA
MSLFLKSLLINCIVFAIIGVTMMIFDSTYAAYVWLFKIWIWITTLIIGYFVIVQIQNSKKTRRDE